MAEHRATAVAGRKHIEAGPLKQHYAYAMGRPAAEQQGGLGVGQGYRPTNAQ